MRAGDKGVFGKGKSSSTAAHISHPDLTSKLGSPRCYLVRSPLPPSFQAQAIFRGKSKITAAGSRLPSTPPDRGLDYSEFACFGKRQSPPKPTGEIAENAAPQQEPAEGMPDNCSTTWDIELEEGNLPSDSSSFACSTTVVIDTGRIWNQGGTQQSLQTIVDSCGKLHSIAARSTDAYPRSSRVASRFFSRPVSGLGLPEDEPAPCALTFDDCPDEEAEVPALGDFVHYHCPGIGWDRSSNQETSSFLGDHYESPLSPLAGKYVHVLGSSRSD